MRPSCLLLLLSCPTCCELLTAAHCDHLTQVHPVQGAPAKRDAGGAGQKACSPQHTPVLVMSMQAETCHAAHSWTTQPSTHASMPAGQLKLDCPDGCAEPTQQFKKLNTRVFHESNVSEDKHVARLLSIALIKLSTQAAWHMPTRIFTHIKHDCYSPAAAPLHTARSAAVLHCWRGTQ